MKQESEFNRVIRNTLLLRSGFGYKISDAQGGGGQQRPFDGVGIYEQVPVFWEAKFSKTLKPLNLKELFEGERRHQMETFETIFQSVPSSRLHLWVPYGVAIPRAPVTYLFEYATLKTLYEGGTLSLHAKVLNNLPTLMIKTTQGRKIIIDTLQPIPLEIVQKALIKS